MEDLRVPKRRVPAEALLASGELRRITLFLAEAASHHAGPERPSDLLNGGGSFVPALDDEAGAITFLNRDGVAAFRLVPGLEYDMEGEDLTLPTEHPVEVTLRSGATLRGLVSYLRPERVRLLEFLNEPAPFFRLLEERAVLLVNKRHVARVILSGP